MIPSPSNKKPECEAPGYHIFLISINYCEYMQFSTIEFFTLCP